MPTPPRPARWTRSPSRARLTIPVLLVTVLVTSSIGIPLASHAAPPKTPTLVRGIGPTANLLQEARASLSPLPAAANTPWTNLSPAPSPSAREGAQMAYDPIDASVLLFGGLTRNRSAADSWEFSGGHWTNLTPGLTLSPPGRYKGGLVYDSVDNEMLLFGGHSGAGYRNDTWAFNGTAWHAVSSIAAPGPREDVAMADDADDHYVLLFGGEAPSGQLTNDTWTFVAGQWTNVTTTISPAPPSREAGGLTYDGADHYVLLFSGTKGVSGILSDTWTYTNGVWTNITDPLNSPPPREEMSLTYDFVDGYVLLFGGFRFPSVYADEWTFVGGVWTSQTVTSLPPPRLDAPIAYYPNLGFGYVLLFGGRSSPLSNASLYNDTWTYKAPVTVTATATSPTIDLGESTHLSVAVTGGYPPYVAYQWHGLPTPCVAGSVSNVTCTPDTNGTYPIIVGATDSGDFNGTSAPLVLRVHWDPSATANASAYAGEAPVPINFTANLTGGTPPFQYAWTFGDGGTDTATAPTHNYTTGGTFHAAVVVTDARGFTATALVAPIAITLPPFPLSTSISASRLSGATPLFVQFSATPSGGVGGYTYAWTLGVPGATSNSSMPAYTYTTPGSYQVVVVVTDAALGTVSANVTIQALSPVPLTVTASADAVLGMAPFAVTFASTAAGGTPPYQYVWTFEPTAGPASGNNQLHTYLLAGTFSATVTVTDANGTTA
ncbi:MAG: PKD domain-containing protein, partial [Thermoplasmata archaeon]|nr:PKD domain-containing protein [Thermoplasmata archaeon]